MPCIDSASSYTTLNIVSHSQQKFVEMDELEKDEEDSHVEMEGLEDSEVEIGGLEEVVMGMNRLEDNELELDRLELEKVGMELTSS
jgi:hypothetical protein